MPLTLSMRVYVQSALSMSTSGKAAQEKASLLAIGDSFEKVVLTRDEDGILTMGLFDFLLGGDFGA